MAAHEAADEIDEPVEHEQPGEEEVPAPARREVVIAGQRPIHGKAALVEPPSSRATSPSTPVVSKLAAEAS